MALLYDQRVAFLKRLTEAVEHNYRSRQRVKQRKSRDAICLLEEMKFMIEIKLCKLQSKTFCLCQLDQRT